MGLGHATELYFMALHINILNDNGLCMYMSCIISEI